MVVFLNVGIFLSCASLRSPRPETTFPEGKRYGPEVEAMVHFLNSRLHYFNVESVRGLEELERAVQYDPNPYLLYEVALAYLQSGRLTDAERVLEALRERGVGEDPDILSLAADLYEQQGRYEDAIAAFKKILALDRTNEDAWLALSQLYSKSHEMPQALDALKELLEIYPTNDRAHYFIAVTYRRMAQNQKAKLHFQRALALNPTLYQANQHLAQIYEQEKRFDQALHCYREILEFRPYDENAHSRIVQIYLFLKQPDHAIEHLLKLEQAQPDNIQIKLNLGRIYFENRQYGKALDVFQSIVALQPDYHAVRFYQGIVLQELNRNEEAIRLFYEIPPESSVYAESVVNLGFLLQEDNRFDESLDVLGKGARVRPEVYEFYDLMASAYVGKQDLPTAIRVLEQKQNQFPSHERLFFHLGTLYDRVGRREDCIAQMKKVIALNEEHASALNYLGYTYAEANMNLVEAEALVKRALAIKPDDGFFLDSLGWVLFKQGNFVEAVAVLIRARRTEPEEAIIHEHLADVYVHLNDRNKAIQSYRRALELTAKMEKDEVQDRDMQRLQTKLMELGAKASPTEPVRGGTRPKE